MEISRTPTRPGSPDAPRIGLKILLAEDDQPLSSGIVSALAADGHIVKALSDGKSAVDEIERATFGLLILDIGLPGLDGFEVLRHVREGGYGLPVPLLTARDAVEDRVLGLEAGADDYMIKPFALLELSARVRARSAAIRPPTVRALFGGRWCSISSRDARFSTRCRSNSPHGSGPCWRFS